MIKSIIGSILLILCNASYAEIYKWVDENGQTHFSDEAPNNRSFNKLDITTTPNTNNTPAPSTEAIKKQQQKMLDVFAEERKAKEKIQQDISKKQGELDSTCLKAKNYLARIKVGGIYNLDKQGKRVYKREDERAQEVERVSKSIQQHCH